MSAILLLFRRVALVGTLISGALVILSAVMITADVISRKILGITLVSGAMSELSGYVLAISTAWAASLALIDRAHVRIDSILMLLGRRARAFFDIIAIAAFAACFTLLAYKAFTTFLFSYAFDTHSLTPLGTPIEIPQFFWAAGLIFLALTAIVLTVFCLVAAWKKDLLFIQRYAGARGVEEDVEEQLQAHRNGRI